MARTYKRDQNGRFAGGGGGGGKPAARGISRGTNRLTRDNSGRITGVGGSGATARGGRLATAKGNQRATQTAKIAGGRSGGTVGKPKGLKPQSSRSLRTGVAVNRQRSINARIGNGPDTAAANIPMAGRRARALDASITKAVATVKASQKPVGKSASAPAVQAAKPKRGQSAESQRLSRAKQTEKRRGMNISNPAAWRQESAGRMAANAARTQERAVAFYKAAAKPARKAIGSISDAKAGRIVARMDANRSGLRRATGTARQTANSIRTHQRAVDFALASGARARKKGQSLSVNQSLQRAVKNASKTRAVNRAGGRITPEKVSRVTGRVNAVTANASSKSGVKRLNATEVGVRAKAFLTRKAGGMSGMVGKTYAQQQAAVAAGMKKPTRYSTQTPNRNKPRAYNELGQANIRRKNQAAANIERNSSATSGRAGNAGGLATATNIRAKAQRLTNIAAANAPTAKALKTRDMGPKAPDTARSRNNRLQTANRRVKYFQGETDSLNYQKAVGTRAKALAARPAGTGGKVVFRGKNKAANRQNIRANDLTRRVRYDLQNARPGAFSATAGGGRSGIRRTDTGSRQLSLLGGASKKLYSSRRVAIQRPSGKRRYGKR